MTGRRTVHIYRDGGQVDGPTDVGFVDAAGEPIGLTFTRPVTLRDGDVLTVTGTPWSYVVHLDVVHSSELDIDVRAEGLE